jgi:type III pantothenate kinase
LKNCVPFQFPTFNPHRKTRTVTNLVVDLGNSRIKVAFFQGVELAQKFLLNEVSQLDSWLTSPHDNIIVSSVTADATPILAASVATGKKIHLTPATPVPVRVQYATPQTLGVDRLAAVCGALQLFPVEPCLVIDAGTCINYEVLDDQGVYMGGIISPGVAMRFKAMHTFTARLPLIEAVENAPLVGNSTQTCMQSGVMNGILEEMRGIMARMRQKYPNLRVILCGGDAALFENQLKPSIFAAPELVLVGLNRILNHNVPI